MRYSQFICTLLLAALSLTATNCSGVPSTYIAPLVVGASTGLGRAAAKAAKAEETSLAKPLTITKASATPKGVFVEALGYVETRYVDEVNPKALMHGAIQGMLKVVAPHGATMPPEISEAMQAVKTEDSTALLKVFLKALTHFETNYPEQANSYALIHGAIRGMLQATDPDGSFMPPNLYREMQVETQGRHGGVGLEMTIRDNILTIVAPIEGSPAFHAGIQPGDQLVKVDGESTKGMLLIEAVSKLRGPEGSPVTLSILRQGFTEPKDFTLTRAIVQIKSVRWQRLQDHIGYIKLRGFQKTTADELEDALQDLEEQHVRALVLDLRNNPGGLVAQVLAVAEKFLENGKLIVYTKGRLASQNLKGFSKNAQARLVYPMVVLVNKGTSAGAEVVAGALQDWQRARILGTPTFGRSSIQTVIPLSDGSALRLTTARFFTPQGHSVQSTGIAPDVVVESPTPERSSFGDLSTDIQLQRAVEMLRELVQNLRQATLPHRSEWQQRWTWPIFLPEVPQAFSWLASRMCSDQPTGTVEC